MKKRSRRAESGGGAARAGTIVLIGLRACGKTTVGRLLARRFKVPFRDTDRILERREHHRVATLLRDLGEPAFRRLEERAVREACRGRRAVVIAAGGGAPTHPASRWRLRGRGRVIYLRAPRRVLVERLSRKTAARTRPLLRARTVRADVARLFTERDRSYARWADVTVAVGSRPPREVVARILARLGGEAGPRAGRRRGAPRGA